ncbi:MAG TPA: cyclic nucleotide-binding domain-containing protein [Hyphomicrobium sp.]|nr:cyclic nucleotide-binding domain-containing protein [Hyphomicrobium sp.]
MHHVPIELLQRMAIFGGVRKETLEFLLGHCAQIEVAKGTFFFRENDMGDCLFVLETGRADVLKSWHGTDHILQTLNPGDCFGEMAVIDHCERSASVRAIEDCTAIRISSADLHRVYAHDLKQFALIQMNMGREVSRRLRDADQRMFAIMMDRSAASTPRTD